MLDYKKLANEIDTYIESLDQEFIKNWLEETYMEYTFLLNETTLNVENENESYNIDSEMEVIINKDDSYQIAA